ncbi:MAG: hypothetical protein ABF636_09155 [Acetobacter sp.]
MACAPLLGRVSGDTAGLFDMRKTTISHVFMGYAGRYARTALHPAPPAVCGVVWGGHALRQSIR